MSQVPQQDSSARRAELDVARSECERLAAELSERNRWEARAKVRLNDLEAALEAKRIQHAETLGYLGQAYGVIERDSTGYGRLLAALWESRRHWQTLHNDPPRPDVVTVQESNGGRYVVGHRHLDGWFVVGYGDALDRGAALELLQDVGPESPQYEFRLLALTDTTEVNEND